jgi:hypothetical protein
MVEECKSIEFLTPGIRSIAADASPLIEFFSLPLEHNDAHNSPSPS